MSAMPQRARDAGIPFAGVPGPRNDVTDVAGVEVGMHTLIAGDAVRTGVTALFPRGRAGAARAVAAGYCELNGNGEMTGTAWIREHGFMTGPVLITTSNSIGVVRDAALGWLVERFSAEEVAAWLPVVAETWDGHLNDVNGFHIKPAHVRAALDGASAGPVALGSVGGGTGMICFEYKGGTGSASRLADVAGERWTVGVLLQTNFGVRPQLTVAGVPVGAHLPPDGRIHDRDHGSVIGVVVTDAPLLPGQLGRLARRVGLGLARTGFMSGADSGDLFLALSTANDGAFQQPGVRSVLEFLYYDDLDPLFGAVVAATEEAAIDSIFANETMHGAGGHTVLAAPREEIVELVRRYGRIG
jgi:L-aminopeptidase/D-esterase-like protein